MNPGIDIYHSQTGKRRSALTLWGSKDWDGHNETVSCINGEKRIKLRKKIIAQLVLEEPRPNYFHLGTRFILDMCVLNGHWNKFQSKMKRLVKFMLSWKVERGEGEAPLGLPYKKDGGAHGTFQGLKTRIKFLLGCWSSRGSRRWQRRYFLGYWAENIFQEIMSCFNIGISLGWKAFQATPTKQDLDTSKGFFSEFPISTTVLFIWESLHFVNPHLWSTGKGTYLKILK